jgi:hypothetical protein
MAAATTIQQQAALRYRATYTPNQLRIFDSPGVDFFIDNWSDFEHNLQVSYRQLTYTLPPREAR